MTGDERENPSSAGSTEDHDGWPDDGAVDAPATGSVEKSVLTSLPDTTGGIMPGDEEAFILKLKSYEGPLDLLLELARRQKVDLTEISVLELVEQYLAVIRAARRLKLELAAAWLVMAAWLTLLKSRLLLPTPPEEEELPDAEEMAARLAFRLKRLEAMREAARQLMLRPRLGLDVHARGQPEPVVVCRQPAYEDNIVDLLSAYANIVKRQAAQREYHFTPAPVWPIHEVREALEEVVPKLADWRALDEIVAAALPDEGMRRSALASGFAAVLELAREGRVELMQDAPLAPLYARARVASAGDS